MTDIDHYYEQMYTRYKTEHPLTESAIVDPVLWEGQIPARIRSSPETLAAFGEYLRWRMAE